MLTYPRKLLRPLIVAYRDHRSKRKYDRLHNAGINPFACISTSGMQLTPEQARDLLSKDQMRVPNVSGFYHNILRMYWTHYGFGEKCLLISETKSVGDVFAKQYAPTGFVTTDYYLELQPNPDCDVVWDLCSSLIPPELNGFTSVVNQATLEHINDPVQVMRNLFQVLKPQGFLYIQTHTPAFYYHGYPRDYLRYFPDWFIDIPLVIRNVHLKELLSVDGHIFAVYQKG